MRHTLYLIAIIVLFATLFLVWANHATRLVVLESSTGNYLTQPQDFLPITDETSENSSSLQEQLLALQQALRANQGIISELKSRIEKIESERCTENCNGRLGLKRLTIHFDFNSSNLNEEEKAKIDLLLIQIQGEAFISLLGQTDRQGDENYNHLLSLRRAGAVKSYIEKSLQQTGLSNKVIITLDGTGEAANAPNSAEDSAANRIVEVLIFQ